MGVRVSEALAGPLAAGEGEALSVGPREAQAEAVREATSEGEGEGEVQALGEALGEAEGLGEALREGAPLGEARGEALALGEAVAQAEAEGLREALREARGEALSVCVSVCEGVARGEAVAEAEEEALSEAAMVMVGCAACCRARGGGSGVAAAAAAAADAGGARAVSASSASSRTRRTVRTVTGKRASWIIVGGGARSWSWFRIRGSPGRKKCSPAESTLECYRATGLTQESGRVGWGRRKTRRDALPMRIRFNRSDPAGRNGAAAGGGQAPAGQNSDTPVQNSAALGAPSAVLPQPRGSEDCVEHLRLQLPLS